MCCISMRRFVFYLMKKWAREKGGIDIFERGRGKHSLTLWFLIFFKAYIQLLISLLGKNRYPVICIAKANRRKSFKCVMKSNKPTQAWLWDFWNDYICVCLSLDLQIRRRIWINDDKKRRFVFSPINKLKYFVCTNHPTQTETFFQMVTSECTRWD